MIDYKKKYIKYKLKYLNLIGGVLPKFSESLNKFPYTIFDKIGDDLIDLLYDETLLTIQNKFDITYTKLQTQAKVEHPSDEQNILMLLLLFRYVEESVHFLISFDNFDNDFIELRKDITKEKQNLDGKIFDLNFIDLLQIWINLANIIKKLIKIKLDKPNRSVEIKYGSSISNTIYNFNSRKFLMFPALFLKKAVEIFKNKTDITEETTKQSLKNLEELSTEILELYIPPFSDLLFLIYYENQKMIKYLKSCQFLKFVKKFNSFRKNINSFEDSSANIVKLLTEFLEVWSEAEKCDRTIKCPNLDDKSKNEIKKSELLELLVPIGQSFLKIPTKKKISVESIVNFDKLIIELEKKIKNRNSWFS